MHGRDKLSSVRLFEELRAAGWPWASRLRALPLYRERVEARRELAELVSSLEEARAVGSLRHRLSVLTAPKEERTF